MRTLDLFRPSVGAFAVGMAQAALDAAVRPRRRRGTAFGGPLKDLQAVAHRLAEMATRTEAARLLVYAAAAAYDAGEPGSPRASAMAKLFATETAQYVVDAAVQIHGARALRRGHLLEHLYREVRAPRIYEGASEVQRTHHREGAVPPLSVRRLLSQLVALELAGLGLRQRVARTRSAAGTCTARSPP